MKQFYTFVMCALSLVGVAHVQASEKADVSAEKAARKSVCKKCLLPHSSCKCAKTMEKKICTQCYVTPCTCNMPPEQRYGRAAAATGDLSNSAYVTMLAYHAWSTK